MYIKADLNRIDGKKLVKDLLCQLAKPVWWHEDQSIIVTGYFVITSS